MRQPKQLTRALVALFLCLLLASCAGDERKPSPQEVEVCQEQFMADVEGGVSIVTSIRRYLDCSELSWLELIRQVS